MMRVVAVAACLLCLALVTDVAGAARGSYVDPTYDESPLILSDMAAPLSSTTPCLSCGSSARGAARRSLTRDRAVPSLALGSIFHWTGAVDAAIYVLLRQTYVDCSWTEVKLCYKYPPGHPKRPECCDGHPPKDPQPPPEP